MNYMFYLDFYREYNAFKLDQMTNNRAPKLIVFIYMDQ